MEENKDINVSSKEEILNEKIQNKGIVMNRTTLKVGFTKSSTKVSLSKRLLKSLGITEENPQIEIIYTSKEIILKKPEQYQD